MSIFDPTLASLKPVLTLLNHDWVQRFFFETPTSERLSQLNYAFNNPVTMSGRFSLSSNVNSAIDTETDFFCAPSFTTGSLTVGFDVEHTDKHTSIYPTRVGKSLAWSVRDDDKGIFLSVTEHPDLGLTELSWCTKITPGSKCLAFALIKESAFRSIARHGFDETIVRQNLFHTLYCLDSRPCPSCGSSPFMKCSCTVSLSRKNHPNDYDGEIRNFDSYLGVFEGFANLRIYENGCIVSVGDFVSVVSASVLGDTEWKQEVRNWAMQETAHGSSMNVTKLSMPNVEATRDPEQLFLRDNTSARLGDNICLDLASPGPAAEDANTRYQDELRRLLSSLCDVGRTVTGASDLVTSIYGRGESGQATSVSQPERKTSRDETIEVTMSREVLNEPRGIGNQSQGACCPGLSTPVPNTSTEVLTTSNQASTGPLAVTQPTYATELSNAVECLSTKVLVPIAPATSASSVRLSAIETEFHRKNEIRKARNRASALRSNEKKRVYLQLLKEDLVTAKRKEVGLREKERSLREENVRLRTLIYKGL